MIRRILVCSIETLFFVYTALLFVRIIASWFPAWHHYTWMRFVFFYTEPFLKFFRRILPPIGGFIDISPILAFFVLEMMKKILLMLLQ